MTLLDELGLVGPIRLLSDSDRKRYVNAVTARYRKRPGKAKQKSIRMKAYRSRPETKEKIKTYRAEYRKREYVREAQRKNSLDYARRNPEKVRRRLREWHREKRHSDMGFRVMHNLRSRLGFVVKRVGYRSVTTGIDSDQLRNHLESLWVDGMSWGNYGSEWHIDHKLPCTSFDLSDPDQVKRCFSLGNLQPLWARENIQKSNKILPEYQGLAS